MGSCADSLFCTLIWPRRKVKRKRSLAILSGLGEKIFKGADGGGVFVGNDITVLQNAFFQILSRLFELVLNVNVCDNFLEIEFLGIEPKFDGRKRKNSWFCFHFLHETLYMAIGHFRVPKSLTFETRLSAKLICTRIKNNFHTIH